MAYYLGRDVNLAMTTEQEAFGLKVTDQVLDITGTDSSALADTDQVPPRVVGLGLTETTSEKEKATLTMAAVPDGDKYENTAADENRYIRLVDADGDSYVISFNDAAAGTYVAPTTGELAAITPKATLTVTLRASFTDATCDTDNSAGSGSSFGSNPKIVQIDSTANLVEGMLVAGTGIASGSVITQIDSETLFRVNLDTTADNDNQTLTFTTDTAVAVAGALKRAINDDATFSKVATATGAGGTSAAVHIELDQVGAATGIVRGGGYADSVMTYALVNEGVTADNYVSDITGIDLTLGAVDEDIIYMGQRTGLKSEIKKENTIVITKKKGKTGTANSVFWYLFNEARCGIRHTSGTIDADVGTADASLELDNSLTMPQATTDGTNFGYRVFIQLKSGTEILTIPNCCISDYSVSLNTDGITEETLTLYSNVTPTVAATANTTITAKSDF